MLIPGNQFHLPIAVVVGHALIVVLVRSTVLDQPPLPRFCEVWAWILPPPHLVAATVLSQNDVQIAVAIHIAHVATRFWPEGAVIDDQSIPPFPVVLVPDDRRRTGSFADREIVDAVLVEVTHNAACLLLAGIGGWQVARRAALARPDFRGIAGGNAKEDDDERNRYDQPKNRADSPPRRVFVWMCCYGQALDHSRGVLHHSITLRVRIFLVKLLVVFRGVSLGHGKVFTEWP